MITESEKTLIESEILLRTIKKKFNIDDFNNEQIITKNKIDDVKEIVSEILESLNSIKRKYMISDDVVMIHLTFLTYVCFNLISDVKDIDKICSLNEDSKTLLKLICMLNEEIKELNHFGTTNLSELLNTFSEMTNYDKYDFWGYVIFEEMYDKLYNEIHRKSNNSDDDVFYVI